MYFHPTKRLDEVIAAQRKRDGYHAIISSQTHRELGSATRSTLNSRLHEQGRLVIVNGRRKKQYSTQQKR